MGNYYGHIAGKLASAIDAKKKICGQLVQNNMD
jgi:hypothetical protein